MKRFAEVLNELVDTPWRPDDNDPDEYNRVYAVVHYPEGNPNLRSFNSTRDGKHHIVSLSDFEDLAGLNEFVNRKTSGYRGGYDRAGNYNPPVEPRSVTVHNSKLRPEEFREQARISPAILRRTAIQLHLPSGSHDSPEGVKVHRFDLRENPELNPFS